MRNTQAIGLIAAAMTIALWAALPVLRGLVSLPPMLTGSVAMLSAAVVAQMLDKGSGAGQPRPPLADGPFWLMGVGGLTGALYFYFLALGEGDPAKVALVTYTWPIGLVLVADKLAGRGLNWRAVAGALVAFTGVAPLVLSSGSSIPTSPLAYSAGIAAGLCWILFSLYLRLDRRAGTSDYKYLFASAAAVTFLLHLAIEDPVAGSTYQDWLFASLIGIGPYGLAFVSWGFALGRASVSSLGILTFMVPILSALYLVFIGSAALNSQMTVAFAAILASGALTQYSGPLLKHRKPSTGSVATWLAGTENRPG